MLRLIFFRFFLLMGFLSVLLACSSQPMPQTQYFLLPIKAMAQASNLQLEVALAPQLQDERILLKQENAIIPAHYNRWKIDLKDNLQQVLTAELANETELKKLHVFFDQFYATQSGQVLLRGHFQLHDNSVKPFSYTLQQEQTGYAAFVKTVSAGLSQLARDIAKEVTH
ncbi:hypothetical protein C2869_05570 [Saccharobesus litoralis]|uniref:ABC-type transport auxiliary lipoprotein component domain-containing protein n=1 Tax=Saccharobesus litoralis TaxID=2172099 RepID=A0A2S0VP24_9ALTE|nr:ABC-type transport auxiliary lipoprotein family protein [Saccharobesus litoralis]AWB65943.1 hypothetical protein C2869_05570 [Saccharobesus litoralis]